ncbi:hypothetical protein OFN63_41175, partial [Escherichia coli]|nr:hypothetical protein [Escherichia coli]
PSLRLVVPTATPEDVPHNPNAPAASSASSTDDDDVDVTAHAPRRAARASAVDTADGRSAYGGGSATEPPFPADDSPR